MLQDGRQIGDDVLPERRRPEDVLPDHAGHHLPAAGGPVYAPSTTSPSTSSAARRSAWSASPAAARSTTGRAILQLYKPTGGHGASSTGTDLTTLGGGDMRKMRRQMQMIFQDPYASLNPRMTVGSIIGEPLRDPRAWRRASSRQERVQELLRSGRPQPVLRQPLPARVLRRPAPAHRHRPRAGRASPSFIVCDEPISALDVSIQAQIINLLEELQEEFDLTYLFIAHDLSRGAPHQRPRGRDVPRQDRRAGRPQRAVRATRCTRTPRRCSRPCRSPTRRSRRKRERIILHGRRAQPGQPAVRLPLPHPLPHRHPGLLRRSTRPSRRKRPVIGRPASGCSHRSDKGQTMGRMTVDECKAFILAQARPAIAAVVRADGRPHVVPSGSTSTATPVVFTTWHTSVKAAKPSAATRASPSPWTTTAPLHLRASLTARRPCGRPRRACASGPRASAGATWAPTRPPPTARATACRANCWSASPSPRWSVRRMSRREGTFRSQAPLSPGAIGHAAGDALRRESA